MDISRILLDEIGPQGADFTMEDPSIWSEPAGGFGVEYRVATPIRADVFVLPEKDGCLWRGRLTGEVILPCDRCAEDARVFLDHQFEDFEAYPLLVSPVHASDERADLDGGEIVRLENGARLLDLAALLWQEFSLALPVKPLCSPQCRGLCPVCGKNLNEGPCGCSSVKGDSRMDALRQFNARSRRA